MDDSTTDLSLEAFSCSRDLVLDFFAAWRGDRDAIDALILLAITRSNVDGILYSRELRGRFGGGAPVAPDHLRQEVSLEILAMSIRLPPGLVRRRVQALAARNECIIKPTGMLITEQQVETGNRLAVVTAVYELLRGCCAQLALLGMLNPASLPDLAPAGPTRPLRSAGAHGAKYVLRLLGGLAAHLGDHVDGLIALQLLRTGGAPRTVTETSARLGLPRSAVERRMARLLSEGILVRVGRGRIVCPADAGWLQEVMTRNLDYLFQLLAGLSEVGALSDFTRPANHSTPH